MQVDSVIKEIKIFQSEISIEHSKFQRRYFENAIVGLTNALNSKTNDCCIVSRYFFSVEGDSMHLGTQMKSKQRNSSIEIVMQIMFLLKIIIFNI